MKITHILSILCAASFGLRAAELKVAPMLIDNALRNGFVTVRLDSYANDQMDAPLASSPVLLNNIPFKLVEKPGVNHLFLKDAGWADWKKDPSSYYSAYDVFPTQQVPHRVLLDLPVADYQTVHLLATCDDDTNFSPTVTFRVGAFGGGQNQVLTHDFTATVPRASEKNPLPFLNTPAGRIFLLTVPLNKAIAQDFPNQPTLTLDVTKELRLAVRQPDPCRYNVRPLGLPSGVRIFGMTFQYSPIQMSVGSKEAGHVFNEPQTPEFQVTLRRLLGNNRPCVIEALARDSYGNETTASVTNITFPPAGTVTVSLPVPVASRGYFDLAVKLRSGRQVLLTRQTSFARLPRDTRKYRSESPFGTWDFGGAHFTSDDPGVSGPLHAKAGLRYGMFHHSDEDRAKYGVLRGNDAKLSAIQVEELAEKIRATPGTPPPERLMIFHENAISGTHITRTPDFFTGRGPYALNEKEHTTFTNMWATAETTARAIRKHFSKTEIYFGNGAPQLLEEFLRHKFPAELLGSRGNECGNFMRMPETQPPDAVANNSGLWMDRALLDGYGYPGTPLRQCYEMCYPSTNPGNLSPTTQARYLVRHMMHSLAWRIPIIRPSCIMDVGNSYYFSNWGACGLCYAMPDVRPKPSYVAMATLTLVLDGATFTRMAPTPSPVIYAFEFKKKDGGHVTCLWTLRGTREVTVANVAGATLTDLMGTETALAGGTFTISADPVFLATPNPPGAITAGPAVQEARPEGRSFVVSPLDKLADWTIETANSLELETYNPMEPRRKGDFAYAETASFEGEANVLAVQAKLPVPGKEFLPMYSVLKHNTGVAIPGEPTRIGLMVNGNGGWGRVIVELQDAAGQRWISIGAEESGEPTRWLADMLSPEEFAKLKGSNRADWNTNDAWQRGSVNFDGWRYLSFPLPGNYPGEGYHWPYNSQWRASGDGVVAYPLTLKKLIVTMPEKILYGTEYKAVPRPAIYLKDLMVTYDPPEKAFPVE